MNHQRYTRQNQNCKIQQEKNGMEFGTHVKCACKNLITRKIDSFFLLIADTWYVVPHACMRETKLYDRNLGRFVGILVLITLILFPHPNTDAESIHWFSRHWILTKNFFFTKTVTFMLWSHLLLFVVFFDQSRKRGQKVQAKGEGHIEKEFL